MSTVIGTRWLRFNTVLRNPTLPPYYPNSRLLRNRVESNTSLMIKLEIINEMLWSLSNEVEEHKKPHVKWLDICVSCSPSVQLWQQKRISSPVVKLYISVGYRTISISKTRRPIQPEWRQWRIGATKLIVRQSIDERKAVQIIKRKPAPPQAVKTDIAIDLWPPLLSLYTRYKWYFPFPIRLRKEYFRSFGRGYPTASWLLNVGGLFGWPISGATVQFPVGSRRPAAPLLL